MAEDREGKRIAVAIAEHDRQRALEICKAVGCTVENTPETDNIKPKLQGMKGQVIDFDDLEFGEGLIDIRLKSSESGYKPDFKRANLSHAPKNEIRYLGGGGEESGSEEDDDPEEFIQLDIGEHNHFQSLNLNHRLRRKIRRAIDSAQVRKEVLVRERARKICIEELGIDPPELSTPMRPIHKRGHRVLANGLLETDKQERIRQRVELVEYNRVMKILRKQAKAIAIEAGLRIHAELTGRIPKRSDEERQKWAHPNGWREPPKEDPKNILRPEDVQRGIHDNDDDSDVSMSD
jgi:hypothetical protein